MPLSWSIVIVLLLLFAAYKIFAKEGLAAMNSSADRLFGVVVKG